MKKTNIAWKIIGILAIFFINSSFFLPESKAQDTKDQNLDLPIEIKGDFLEYDKRQSLVYGKGHLVINYGDLEIKADEAKINLETQDLEASGNLTLQEKEQKTQAQRIVYNLKTKKGQVFEGKTCVYNWYCQGPELQRQSEEKIYIPKGYFTTCDLDQPHYRLKATRISIILKKRLVAHNVFLCVGNTPVFYFPFYWQSLKEKKYKLDVRIGHNSVEGDFVKVGYGYPLSEHTYGTLYLDYLEYLGWGKGFQYDYDLPDKLRGSLYSYHIHQKARIEPPIMEEAEKWKVNFLHWQRLPWNFVSQADISFTNDQYFNQRFDQQDKLRVVRDINSYLSFTQTTPKYTLRILERRRYLWDDTKGEFVASEVNEPQVSFALNKLQIPWPVRKVPLYGVYSINLTRQLIPSSDYYQWGGNTQASLSSSLNLTRRVVFNPEMGLQGTWQDRIKQTEDFTKNIFTGRYFTNLNLRTRVIDRYLDVDLTHNYTNEKITRHATKGGVLTNRLGFASNLYLPKWWKKKPQQFFRLTTSIGYNLLFEPVKNPSDPSIKAQNWTAGLDNLTSDLYVTPNPNTQLKLREEYNIFEKQNKRIDAELQFAKDNNYFTVGVNYLKNIPDTLDIRNSFNFDLTKKWRIGLNSRFNYYLVPQEYYDSQEGKYKYRQSYDFAERGIDIYRNLHCWEIRLSWSKRATEEQIWVKFNLTAFPKRKIGVNHTFRTIGNIQEEEWKITRE